MEAAVLEYRRALVETRDSVPVMNRLAEALLRLARDREALEILNQAKGIVPDHPTIYTLLGRAYLKLKDFPSAREALESSIQINPFNPEVHQNLALACEALGDSAKALREREIARKLLR
jgi:tetratricopeptide (TPR) repeat protein